ncbi:class I SAM-dependent methyltransferase [Corynebacterium belfantii]|uniref:class I SAM-dependent methyltransferase n=1 Tax=Corynebacterium belfantii TaxID=2014537 RepID=UPI0018D3B5C3|nr:class I SAM-dependent methyltransferase [Corynebacterium belfantii]
MSGSGRLAFLAAQRGHRVTAFDNSPDIIAINRWAGQDVTFFLGDVLKEENGLDRGAADIVTCSGKSISLLSNSDRNLFYGSVRGALRNGGLFFGDAYSQFTVESTTSNVVPLNLSAGRLLWSQAQTCPASSTMITNFFTRT